MKTILTSDQKRERKFRRRNRVKTRLNIVASDKTKLMVYRSNSFIYAQLVSPDNKVLGASSDQKVKTKGTKTQKAQKVGDAIASIAKSHKITEVVFDRNGFVYAGRVKALAE